MNPRVKKVKVEPNYLLRLTFSNGENRIFDMKPYLSIGVFKDLKEKSAFKTARVSLGSVQWKGGQDLCPDTLYEESVSREKISSVAFVGEKEVPYKVPVHHKPRRKVK